MPANKGIGIHIAVSCCLIPPPEDGLFIFVFYKMNKHIMTGIGSMKKKPSGREEEVCTTVDKQMSK